MLENQEMDDLPLFSQPRQVAQKKHWTVTELTTQIRGVLEPAFSQVWVVGEVSNFRPAASGHVYFSLKDQNATISAAIFGWGARKKGFDLKDGVQLLCRGKLSIYPPRGTYQLIVDHVEPLGAGALQLAFEKLKTQLAAEGWFDASRKRPLPSFPSRIAVVTSPSGAAIQDMLNILKRRAPQIRVTIIPALVQGDGAPAQLIRGIELANRYQLGDLIVLARGGGSIEDLWCFNDVELAKAIRSSALPIVSAVGHEIDFTISDFVADLRAPTPSAAAEIVSGKWVETHRRVLEWSERLKNAMLRDLVNRKKLFSHIAARVVSPRDRLREQMQRTDELSLRLNRSIQILIERRKQGLERWMGQLDALSPLRVLERGYTLVLDPNHLHDEGGGVIKSEKQVRGGQELEIQFFDGKRRVQTLPIR